MVSNGDGPLYLRWLVLRCIGESILGMILSDAHFKFILVLLDCDSDIYLDEISEQLMDQCSSSVSLSTVQRMLKLFGITTKKVHVSITMYTICLWFYSY